MQVLNLLYNGLLQVSEVGGSAADSNTVVSNETIRRQAVESAPDYSQMFSFWNIFWAVITIAVGWLLIRFAARLIELYAERNAERRFAIKGSIPIVRLLGWIVVFYMIIAGIFRPSYETFIAALASAGIAVGFAAQDLLKNIFGGIILLVDRPFVVGDKIDVDGNYGEVIEIGLRSTRIVTPDDSVVTIPNGELNTQLISNSNSGEANCQVVAEIYLPIDTDTKLARKIAKEVALTSPYIYLNKPITVLFFNEVKERRSYLKMRLKAYVHDIRAEFAFKSDMTERVVQQFLENDVVKKDGLM